MQTSIPDLKITHEQAKRLLIEYPQLNEAYQSKVPTMSTLQEQDFWKEFLMKNNKYQTEIFGGNNPLFIPSVTDEMVYDEIYVNDNFNQFYAQRKV